MCTQRVKRKTCATETEIELRTGASFLGIPFLLDRDLFLSRSTILLLPFSSMFLFLRFSLVFRDCAATQFSIDARFSSAISPPCIFHSRAGEPPNASTRRFIRNPPLRFVQRSFVFFLSFLFLFFLFFPPSFFPFRFEDKGRPVALTENPRFVSPVILVIGNTISN